MADAADEFFARWQRLLRLEADAEAERLRERLARLSASEAERLGTTLLDLAIYAEDTGLGGRCTLTLGKRNRTLSLPWTRLRTGSPVNVRAGETAMRGVVSGRTEQTIRVVVDEPPDNEVAGESFRVDLASDEVSRRRIANGLSLFRDSKKGPHADWVRTLLGDGPPPFHDPAEPAWFNGRLDASQRVAVMHALAAQRWAIVHGPPGTGKTTTLVEIVRQRVRRGERVLVCAPSNLAVDNLLGSLANAGESVVRLGHPARVQEALQEQTLDAQVAQHDDTRRARQWMKEAFALFRQAGRWTRAKPEAGSKFALRQEGKALMHDARQLERQTVTKVLDRAKVVGATLTGLDAELLGDRRFDCAVIDEAGQGTEPAAWLPLAYADCLILAGDHCQLPPTVLSNEARRGGMGISQMERLLAHFGPAPARRLSVQYRMHADIGRFSSERFYDGELQPHDSVAGHLLSDLPSVERTPLTERPVEFVDTAGSDCTEEPEADGESLINPGEAKVVHRRVLALLAAGVAASDMAVIAPYAGQVRYLRERLERGVDIDTVDGFQGQEREAVIYSLVRSNPEGDIGFLSDTRRTNVALTRARRKLIVIGDSATLGGHPFYQALLESFEALGAYGSVWEEPDDADLP